MSILAGVFSRRPEVRPDGSWADEIRRAISRNTTDTVEEFRDCSAILCKIDSGAFGSPAFFKDPSGSVSMLIGEPLLAPVDPRTTSNRARDLETLHKSFVAGNWDILKSSQGSFTGVLYEPSNHVLHFFSDKLGVRQLYYWLDEHWVFYATAMRVLEALSFVPKVMDVRGVTEITGFAFPLGTRTAYVGMKTIRGAEIVSAWPSRLESKQYWHWDAIPVSRRPESELLREVHDRFRIAVQRRLRGDRIPLAFLSGGLDSRCLVATLTEESDLVHTLNFSLPRTEDEVYGAEMAKRLGTIHHHEEMMIANPRFFQRVSEVAQSLAAAKPTGVSRPLLIWSGDGGSVGLGHVYITEETVNMLRRDDLDSCITQFLREERKQVVARLLRPEALRSLAEVFQHGMKEELKEFQCEDPGRAIYCFLLLNDQRRHLARLPEDVDVNRFEFITPFFDGDFLSAVASVPLNLCLKHSFYNKWLSCFRPEVLSVPWQVYPTHEACPVPPLPGLVSQFDRSEYDYLHLQKKQHLLQETRALLASEEFPERLLNRRFLRFAYEACRWGLRDYAYVLDTATVYARYWRTSKGKYVLPA